MKDIGYRSMHRVNKNRRYILDFHYRSLRRASKNCKNKHFNSRSQVQDGFLERILKKYRGHHYLKTLEKSKSGFLTEIRQGESQKREVAGAPQCRKVAKHCVFFQCFVTAEGSKSRLAKAAGAEPAGQMRDQTVHDVVARSTSGNQNVQTTSAPDQFWKLRCGKSHAVVARSTFGSKR